MTVPLEETFEGKVALGGLDQVLDFEPDVIAAGPGLGTSPEVTAFVHGLVTRSDEPARARR